MLRLIRMMAPERLVTQSVAGETRITLIYNCHLDMNTILGTTAILIAAMAAAAVVVAVVAAKAASTAGGDGHGDGGGGAASKTAMSAAGGGLCIQANGFVFRLMMTFVKE